MVPVSVCPRIEPGFPETHLAAGPSPRQHSRHIGWVSPAKQWDASAGMLHTSSQVLLSEFHSTRHRTRCDEALRSARALRPRREANQTGLKDPEQDRRVHARFFELALELRTHVLPHRGSRYL